MRSMLWVVFIVVGVAIQSILPFISYAITLHFTKY